MRTTLTLDPDVAMRVQKLVDERKMTLKDVVNRALRSGLREVETPPKRKPFKVKPFSGKLAPGLDWARLGKLAWDLEDEDIIAQMKRDSSRH